MNGNHLVKKYNYCRMHCSWAPLVFLSIISFDHWSVFNNGFNCGTKQWEIFAKNTMNTGELTCLLASYPLSTPSVYEQNTDTAENSKWKHHFINFEHVLECAFVAHLLTYIQFSWLSLIIARFSSHARGNFRIGLCGSFNLNLGYLLERRQLSVLQAITTLMDATTIAASRAYLAWLPSFHSEAAPVEHLYPFTSYG